MTNWKDKKSRSEYWKKRWRERNKEKWNTARRKWYRKNKKKSYTASREWVMKNKDRVRAAQKRYRQNLRRRVLEKLGGKCNNPACQWLNADGTRGCVDFRCLQVDHVKGGGTQENIALASRTRLYWKVLKDSEGVYQLLCANCNWIKRHTNAETH